MATSQLDIIINGVDNASDEFEAISQKSGKLDLALKGLAIGGLAAAGTAVVGLGKTIFDTAVEFDDAADAIIRGTGASGEALDAMTESVKNLYGSQAGLGRGMEEIGAVIAEVNTRTGATGETLEEFSAQILEMTRLTGGDAVSNVQNITRVMADWNLSTEEGTRLLDDLYAAGQVYGIGVDELTSLLDTNGAALQTWGLSLTEGINLFGQFERGGVDAASVMTGLEFAIKKMADKGIDPSRESLDTLLDSIRNAETDAEGLNLAVKYFGGRAGPEMFRVIRDGKLDVDDLATALGDTAGTIDETGEATNDFKENWEIAWKDIKTAMLPVGEEMLRLLNELMPAVTEYINNSLVPAVSNIADSISRLREVGAGQFMGETFQQQLQQIEETPELNEFYTGPGLIGNIQSSIRGDQPWIRPEITEFFQGFRQGMNGPAPAAVTVNQAFYGNADAATQSTAAQRAAQAWGVTP